MSSYASMRCCLRPLLFQSSYEPSVLEAASLSDIRWHTFSYSYNQTNKPGGSSTTLVSNNLQSGCARLP
jgi:hypothetical protein